MGNRQTQSEKQERQRQTRGRNEERKFVTGELCKSFGAADVTLLYPHYHTSIGPTIADDYRSTQTKLRGRHPVCLIPFGTHTDFDELRKKYFPKSHAEMRAAGLSYLVTCSYTENWLGNPVDPLIAFVMETDEFDRTLPIGK
jgi:hypothetical protein